MTRNALLFLSFISIHISGSDPTSSYGRFAAQSNTINFPYPINEMISSEKDEQISIVRQYFVGQCLEHRYNLNDCIKAAQTCNNDMSSFDIATLHHNVAAVISRMDQITRYQYNQSPCIQPIHQQCLQETLQTINDPIIAYNTTWKILADDAHCNARNINPYPEFTKACLDNIPELENIPAFKATVPPHPPSNQLYSYKNIYTLYNSSSHNYHATDIQRMLHTFAYNDFE